MADKETIELNGFTLPANVRLAMSESGLMVGAHYSNSMTLSGVVSRLVYIGNGVIRAYFKESERTMLVFSTGMTAEEVAPPKPEQKAKTAPEPQEKKK